MSAAEQLPLYPTIREPTVPTRASELDEQARDWLQRNPDAWRAFCRFANQAYQSGRRIGAKLICERLRWESKVEMSGDPWVLNNSHVASLARIYQATYPERAHVFETRARTSAEKRARQITRSD